MAGRTPKQAMGDAKKRKNKPLSMALPKLGAKPPSMDALPDLASLRTWVKPAQAKMITAKAKRVAIGKVSTK